MLLCFLGENMRLDVATTVLIFVLCLSLMIYHFIRSQYFISSRNVLYFYLRAREMVEKESFQNVYVEKIFLYYFNGTGNYRVEKLGTPSTKYIYTIYIYKLFENGSIIIYRIYFKS